MRSPPEAGGGPVSRPASAASASFAARSETRSSCSAACAASTRTSAPGTSPACTVRMTAVATTGPYPWSSRRYVSSARRCRSPKTRWPESVRPAGGRTPASS